MPRPAVSQSPRPQVGDRVRVQSVAPRSDRLTGILVALNSDSLSLEVSGDQHSFALRELEYLKVSTGEKSRLAGTIVGFWGPPSARLPEQRLSGRSRTNASITVDLKVASSALASEGSRVPLGAITGLPMSTLRVVLG